MQFDLMHGVRVIESSAFIAAPLAGLALSQFGADVIRIDMIGGGLDYRRLPVMPGGRSFYWTGLNKAKRSIAIDIKRPEGRELVCSLVTAPGPGGGVLLTNLGAPWLAHASLARERSDLITCTIEGNPDGSTAVDYTVNCATGFPSMTGGGTISEPVNHVLPAWDVACAYQAAFAIAAALGRRTITGEGAQLRIALSDVAFSTLSHLGTLAEAELLDLDRPSIGNDLYGAFGRDFGTADGERLFVAAISLGQWKSLVRACAMEQQMKALEQSLGLDFADEAERYEARAAIAAVVERWCASRTMQEAAVTFTANKVCWGRYETVRSLLARDARVSTANPIFGRIHTPGVGNHLAAGASTRVIGAERPPLRPAPLLGQDTDAILAEVLGLDSAAVGKLHDAGVVAGPARDPLMPSAAAATASGD